MSEIAHSDDEEECENGLEAGIGKVHTPEGETYRGYILNNPEEEEEWIVSNVAANLEDRR